MILRQVRYSTSTVLLCPGVPVQRVRPLHGEDGGDAHPQQPARLQVTQKIFLTREKIFGTQSLDDERQRTLGPVIT